MGDWLYNALCPCDPISTPVRPGVWPGRRDPAPGRHEAVEGGRAWFTPEAPRLRYLTHLLPRSGSLAAEGALSIAHQQLFQSLSMMV